MSFSTSITHNNNSTTISVVVECIPNTIISLNIYSDYTKGYVKITDSSPSNTQYNSDKSVKPDVKPDEPVTPDVKPDEPVTPDVKPDEPVTPDVKPDEPVIPDVKPDEPRRCKRLANKSPKYYEVDDDELLELQHDYIVKRIRHICCKCDYTFSKQLVDEYYQFDSDSKTDLIPRKTLYSHINSWFLHHSIIIKDLQWIKYQLYHLSKYIEEYYQSHTIPSQYTLDTYIDFILSEYIDSSFNIIHDKQNTCINQYYRRNRHIHYTVYNAHKERLRNSIQKFLNSINTP
jgi:hypothetical protein